jgi:hypothetical protein
MQFQQKQTDSTGAGCNEHGHAQLAHQHFICVMAATAAYCLYVCLLCLLLLSSRGTTSSSDMEGPDAQVFAELRHNTTLPRQIAAELHLRPPPPEATALPPEAARSPAQLALIFSHLAALGYGATSRVDNTGGQPGCCSRECFARVLKVAVLPDKSQHGMCLQRDWHLETA